MNFGLGRALSRPDLLSNASGEAGHGIEQPCGLWAQCCMIT